MKASSFPRMYRAWNLETKEMLSPEKLASLGFSIAPDGLPVYKDRPFPVVVMWYSDKVDKNGKNIAEGDICKVLIENEFGSLTVDYGVMRWNKKTLSFMLMIPSSVGGQLFSVQSVELLGNEFENPELVPLTKSDVPVLEKEKVVNG